MVEGAGEPVVERVVSRSRVRQALVCPYCRDELSRGGVVACARRGCGALYHRECWTECAEHHGACAVMGCGSSRSREVSALGYALRWLRLAVAAVLFPPRLVRALVRTTDPESAGQGYLTHDADATMQASLSRVLAVGGGKVLLAVAVVEVLGSIAWLSRDQGLLIGIPGGLWLAMLLFLLTLFPFCLACLFYSFVLSFLAKLAVNAARGVAFFLKGEVAALGRVERAPVPPASDKEKEAGGARVV